ncbi:response regulator [Scytonema sp. UIC 10036]|uniref:response regulator n=1 Tax=Scytonema sp. UIC 10036 TaxID=2304196 RepID=UPI0012DA7059|nr:response regulator [Scytonema sp. UIC 10036]MUG96699.1 response regulator [Scytonema sp. UIC 10036]
MLQVIKNLRASNPNPSTLYLYQNIKFKKNQEVKIEELSSLSNILEELPVSLEERLELFEKVLTHLSIGIPDSQLLQEAQIEAHHLASSFENYGLPMGSKVAREAEFLLQTLANWRQHTALLLNRLEKLTICLKETLQQPKYLPITSVLPQLPSTRLLIIDCETILTERIKQEAANHSLQVDVATNLTVAKSIIASRPPNVVLLDIAIGKSYNNSLKFLAQLIKDKPKLPVIIFTTLDQLYYRVEVARLGAYTFLHKNTPVDEVLSQITKVVNQSPDSKAKVMVVDDDPLILYRIKTLLLPWKLQVTTLQSPEEFWQILEAINPDLLILDIEMPGFNGIDLCQAVRNDSRWSLLPILFLSVHSEAKVMHKVYTVGADDYVQKPIIEHEFITRIFNRLERRNNK